MKKYLLIFVLFLFVLSSLYAEYEGSFLEIGVGARANAMGNAYTAMPLDGYSFYWNPAALATLQNLSIIAQHAKLFNGLEHHNIIGFTQPIFGGNYISLNLIRLSVPDIPRFYSDNIYDSYTKRALNEATQFSEIQELINADVALTNPALGYSDFTNDAIYMTFSKMNFFNVDFGWQYFVLPVEMPIGVNFKIIKQDMFGVSASGIGMDLGWMLRFGLNDLFDDERLGKLSFGAVAKDIWKTKITWNNDTRHSGVIDRTMAAGISYWQPINSINSSFTVSYDLQNKYNNTHHVGMEYSYGKKVAIRFGMNDGRVSLGTGIKVWIINVDYAYIGHDLGNTHRIGLNIEL